MSRNLYISPKAAATAATIAAARLCAKGFRIQMRWVQNADGSMDAGWVYLLT